MWDESEIGCKAGHTCPPHTRNRWGRHTIHRGRSRSRLADTFHWITQSLTFVKKELSNSKNEWDAPACTGAVPAACTDHHYVTHGRTDKCRRQKCIGATAAEAAVEQGWIGRRGRMCIRPLRNQGCTRTRTSQSVRRRSTGRWQNNCPRPGNWLQEIRPL